MISHSELTRKLMQDLSFTDAQRELVIGWTRNGVIHEGGEIPEPSFGKATPASRFRFGTKSKRELEGVKPELVRVAELAIQLSTQDFMIFDGLRTKAEQINMVRRGASKTMNSKHLPQADGFSHAFDAVPVVGTLPKWEWNLIYLVVLAVDKAATQLGYDGNIRWGGAWDRRLSDFGGSEDAYKQECIDYCARHPGMDFIDGPHFEWVD